MSEPWSTCIKGTRTKASLTESTSADVERVWCLALGAVTNPRKSGNVRLIWHAAEKVGNISSNSKLITVNGAP